jgi:predicted hydrocarbon binding protein
MFKRLKKELGINVDEDTRQLYLGKKKKDLRLLMLRPLDIIEFAEFAGTNADDIIIWVGKTIGTDFLKKFFYEKEDWDQESLLTRKETILGSLEALILMGYGYLTGTVKKDHILISVYESAVLEEEENVMAKNLCLLYQGIFQGILEALGFEVEGEEIECVLKGGKRCTFKFDLLIEEFPDELVDEEVESAEAISDFLGSL